MINGNKLEDLARLYRLFIMVPTGLPCIKRALKDSIAERGKEINRVSLGIDGGDMEVDIVNNDQSEIAKRKGKGKGRPAATTSQTLSLALKWVQDVLDLKDLFDSVWRSAFDNDREVESALNEVGVLRECERDWNAYKLIIGFRVLYQRQREVTRIHLVVHRRESEEGSQRGEDIICDTLIITQLVSLLEN